MKGEELGLEAFDDSSGEVGRGEEDDGSQGTMGGGVGEGAESCAADDQGGVGDGGGEDLEVG